MLKLLGNVGPDHQQFILVRGGLVIWLLPFNDFRYSQISPRWDNFSTVRKIWTRL